MTPVAWLIDENSHKKASVKFEIKQLEAKLHRLINLEHLSARPLLLACCTELIVYYAELLKIISANSVFPQVDESLGVETSLPRCYAQLIEHRQQWPSLLSPEGEVRSALRLWRHYRKIKRLLTEQNNSAILDESFLAIAQAKTPGLWLQALIDYANHMHENVQILSSQLLQLNNEQLLNLQDQFSRPDLVALANTLFFYKINPDWLYDGMHAEKIISVKNRLTRVHRFIEFFYQSLLHGLRHRHLNAGHDLLFHGDELQEGITLEPDASYQLLIREVIKDWQLQDLVYPEESSRLQEFFRAYKFWFNPKRLIDAVMSLPYAREIDNFGEGETGSPFNQQVRLIYQPLSTTECLDLYGYFANKDSNYLLRTLQAAGQGHAIPGFIILDQAQQAIIYKVYQALDTVMESLRDELANRGVVTQAYVRSKNNQNIKPGRRVNQALHHILSLYYVKPSQLNTRLQQLFDELDN